MSTYSNLNIEDAPVSPTARLSRAPSSPLVLPPPSQPSSFFFLFAPDSTDKDAREASETIPKNLIGRFVDVKGLGVGKVVGFEKVWMCKKSWVYPFTREATYSKPQTSNPKPNHPNIRTPPRLRWACSGTPSTRSTSGRSPVVRSWCCSGARSSANGTRGRSLLCWAAHSRKARKGHEACLPCRPDLSLWPRGVHFDPGRAANDAHTTTRALYESGCCPPFCRAGPGACLSPACARTRRRRAPAAVL